MKLQYIYNSSFHIETEHYQILFDYFQGKVDLHPEKPCLFVVTHGHSDHYDPFIFEMARVGDLFLLSSDIEVEESENVKVVSPFEKGTIGPFKYETSGSTDAGISILLEIEGKTILHAGDLNEWVWPEDSPEEVEAMKKDFKRFVDEFKGKQVDVGFFPVDARLEEQYIKGPLYFIETVRPKVFVPMHFREHFDILNDFGKRAGSPYSKLWIPTFEYDTYNEETEG
ncbi:MBL fold metallo-hydrolase [Guggenheimella bovis]